MKNATMMPRLTKFMFVVGFLLTTIMSYANNLAYAQNQTFTFHLKNVSIKTVLQTIEKQSEFIFMYRSDLLDTSKRVSVDADKKSVSQILDQILEGTAVTYEINDRQIVLKKAEKPISAPKQTGKRKKIISGIITDEVTQEPIIGAAIMVKGTSVGTTTNVDGNFTLQCVEEDTLVVSYMGYEDKIVVVKSGNVYAITMKEAAEQLGEVVVTAFGVAQKKESLVGSVQQIKPKELKVPSSSLSSAFAGRMAGVIAVQRSGEPGADGADFWIRGKSTFSGATGALIILDGVEISASELNALDPEVIESFSILKDATATALYGTRGANGVMIVTTKNGERLDKPIINVRVEGSMSQMTRVPEMVDGVTYMNLFNEAVSRPNCLIEPFAVDKIEGTKKRLNPYIYPNVNWYDEMFNKNSFAQRVNFNIRGGSRIMDYFMSASLKHNNGNLKPLSKDFFSYNNNINVYNYDFVNNLRINATPTTKVSLGLNLSVTDWKGPLRSANELFQMSKEVSPVDYPVFFPSGKLDTNGVLWGDKPGGPWDGGYRNPVAEYVIGYKTSLNSKITANFKLEQDLSFLTDGLGFSGLFSFKNITISNVERVANYNRYYVSDYNPSTLDYVIKRLGDERDTSLKTTGTYGGERKMYFQAVLDYNRIFDGRHDVSAMLLYNHQQYNTNMPVDLYTSLPQRKQGFAGRLSYVYDSRYMIEANFGYNGSENFAKGNRFGFFPSIAVGYTISQEKYWDQLRDYISHMKVRASWGLVGNDQIGADRFAYMEDLVLSGSGTFTTGINQDLTLSGPKWKRYFNPNLTWEVGEKINVGLDLQILNSLNVVVDVFKETRSHIFMSRQGSLPQVVGTSDTQIYSNLGKMENKGLDLSIDYNKQISKDWFISGKGTFTFARNKVLAYDEPLFRDYPALSRVGRPLGLHLGYISQGLFPDQATIDKSPEQTLGYIPMPGDIWYVNQPNYKGEYDNKIDGNDRVYMGMPVDPEIVYGFGASTKYKNWDFSLFFQGVARTSLMMSGIHPFGTASNFSVADFIAEDHWSVDNPNPNAAYPRLTKDNNNNNEAVSDYWLRDASFLKLRNAEVGYTYKNMRFYLSGANLLTFSPFKHWDPEMGGGNGLKYPTQRVWNLGFQITFK